MTAASEILGQLGIKDLHVVFNEFSVGAEMVDREMRLSDHDGNDVTDDLGVEVWLEPHPEGADRGGYVKHASHGDSEIYYDNGNCEWFPND